MTFNPTWQTVFRIGIKAGLLFVMINVLFATASPLPQLGHLSIYNVLVPGRERLPYGVSPDSYNLSPSTIEMMFASHQVASPKLPDEYRVFLLGDSSVWGFLLENKHTLSGYLNAGNYHLSTGQKLTAYNLGYLQNSITKDVLLLDYAKQYQPDMILWLITPESFYRPTQLDPAILQHHPDRVRTLINQYHLQLNPQDERFIEPDFWGRTLVGQRRELANWLRLQAYGFTWAATGIDQAFLPYTPRSNDFDTDTLWHDYAKENPFTAEDLAFDVLSAGAALAQNIPLLIINEPIFIADGRNSDLHYNAWYPRWMYDHWRAIMAQQAQTAGWHYIDLWDSIAPTEFTDSPVHLTPAGSEQLSQLLAEIILAFATR